MPSPISVETENSQDMKPTEKFNFKTQKMGISRAGRRKRRRHTKGSRETSTDSRQNS
jgi:hypothetical protein